MIDNCNGHCMSGSKTGAVQVEGFDDVEITGKRNLVFVGDFPELKLCEGSGNKNSGSSVCCLALAPKAALQGDNCAYTPKSRRSLSECGPGTFNIAEVCQRKGLFCDKDGYSVDWCLSCDLCETSDECSDQCSRAATQEAEEGEEGEQEEQGEQKEQGEQEQPSERRLLNQQNFKLNIIHPNTPLGQASAAVSLPVNIQMTHQCTGAGCRKKLKIDGDDNLVFIGHFPKLKMCEGSGNEGEGQVNCCIKVQATDITSPSLSGDQCVSTTQDRRVLDERDSRVEFLGRRVLDERDSRVEFLGRRVLDEACPSGTFDIRKTCEENKSWCHETEGAIDGCLDCKQCPSFASCPTCAPDRRKN